MGDPQGIGPEVAIKALINSEINKISRPIIIGDLKVLALTLKKLKLPGVSLNPIKKIEEAEFIKNKFDVLDLDNVDISKFKPGSLSKMCGKASVEYVETAIKLALSKKIDAITTGPINKEAIHKAGLKYDGHTEILAKYTKSKDYGMLFVAEPFWVLLVTTHIALKDVSRSINYQKVLNKIIMAHETMFKQTGKKPKIAVAGLNPHAGENGIFGKEEIKSIAPAVKEAQKRGIDCVGPISPDAVFNLAKIRIFDIVVAMYHDQGLIPLKLLSFNKSVNVTIGLPIIRTSVDHGTGFDIAGRGFANPSSMIQAIKIAAMFANSRLK